MRNPYLLGQDPSVKDPSELGFWGLLKQRAFMPLIQQQLKEQGRQQVQGLIGQERITSEFMPDTFPGEDPRQLSGSDFLTARGGMPASMSPQQSEQLGQVLPQAGLLNIDQEASGLLGSQMTPKDYMKFYGGLLSTPGYENIGAQGLMGMQGNDANMQRKMMEIAQSSKDKNFDYADKLRDEFSKDAGEFKKVSDAYGRVIAAADKPTAAGDMALIFNYMKLLDPGSTVREGEYATAQQATGVPGQVLNLYNRLTKGERLNPEQRQDFFGRSQKLYDSQLVGLEQIENQYAKLATGFGVSPKNVVIDYRVNRKAPDMKTGLEIPEPVEQSFTSDKQKRLEELRKAQGGS